MPFSSSKNPWANTLIRGRGDGPLTKRSHSNGQMNTVAGAGPSGNDMLKPLFEQSGPWSVPVGGAVFDSIIARPFGERIVAYVNSGSVSTSGEFVHSPNLQMLNEENHSYEPGDYAEFVSLGPDGTNPYGIWKEVWRASLMEGRTNLRELVPPSQLSGPYGGGAYAGYGYGGGVSNELLALAGSYPPIVQDPDAPWHPFGFAQAAWALPVYTDDADPLHASAYLVLPNDCLLVLDHVHVVSFNPGTGAGGNITLTEILGYEAGEAAEFLLLGDIDDNDSSFNIDTDAGSSVAPFAANDAVIVGNREVMIVTSISANGPTSFTVNVDRANATDRWFGSPPVAHTTGDSIRKLLLGNQIDQQALSAFPGSSISSQRIDLAAAKNAVRGIRFHFDDLNPFNFLPEQTTGMFVVVNGTLVRQALNPDNSNGYIDTRVQPNDGAP